VTPLLRPFATRRLTSGLLDTELDVRRAVLSLGGLEGGDLTRKSVEPGDELRRAIAPGPAKAQIEIAERACRREMTDVARRVRRRGVENSERAIDLAPCCNSIQLAERWASGRVVCS
jgi:hypothetical protein